MAYIDGFVLVCPDSERETFIRHAETIAGVFLDHGALRVVEGWGDDVPEVGLVSFPQAVRRRAGESVLFSFIEWPSRAVRDDATPKVIADPRLAPDKVPLPIDPKRMIAGGFLPVVDRKARTGS